MIGNIVVAVDGSDHGQRALEKAADIASGCGASLTILHVHLSGRALKDLSRFAESEHLLRKSDLAKKFTESAATASAAEMVRNTLESESRSGAATAVGDVILRDAAETAREMGVKTVSVVAEDGDPTEAILRVARSRSADLIVMGSRGLGALRELLVGSVSHKVTSHADISVLIAR